VIGTHNAQNELDYIESKELCDGAKSYVMQVNYCIVPIAKLRQTPYNLVRFELIKVKIRA